MESNYPNPSTRTPMYPQLNPQSSAPFSNPEPSAPLYPTVDFSDLYDNNTNTNPFPDQTTFHFNQIPPSATTLHFNQIPPSAPVEESSKTSEESLLTIPNTILNLIDKNYSIELASGNFQILRLLQQTNTLAVLATVADDIQFPLTKDIAAVKLDSSHYFFSFNPPSNIDSIENDKKSKKHKKSKKKEKEKIKEENEQVLSYGLTILGHSEEGENLLDWVLDSYCNFSVREVKENAVIGKDVAASLGELERQDVGKNKKKDVVEGKCAAYWTTLAPNVEDYSGSAARLIASGSGQLVKGILWCGDVTGERLNWGEEVMRKRMAPGGKDAVVDPSTLKRIKRVKRVSKMTNKVAIGLLSGAVKVSGYLTGSIANSKAGKKFFSMLPGEILLASLDGFSKICDAAEVSGKHVMSTSSTVTTGLVTHKYGDEAGKATSEGLDAAGNAIGTAWTVFKIRQALNPKSVLKPTTLAKTAAKSALSEKKAKK